MPTIAELEFYDEKPAEDGKVIAISVDATSRSYDLSAVALGAPFSAFPFEDLTTLLTADGNDVYYSFSSAAKTVDDTAAVALGGAAAFTANACGQLVKGTARKIRINRTRHKFLNIKCAATLTAKLRIHLSAPPPAKTV